MVFCSQASGGSLPPLRRLDPFFMLSQFALRLVCGMSLMWCLMPRSRVTAGFFRIQMLIVLGLSVLAAASMGDPGGPTAAAQVANLSTARVTACVLIAVSAFLGSIVWTLQRRRAGNVFVILIAGISTAALTAAAAASIRPDSLNRLVAVLSELSTALLLGGATTGMLLGHWYLTAPTMSITPLNRVNLYFGAAGLSRLVLSAVALWLAWDRLTGPTHWVWLSLRWSAGIVAPLLLCVMVWRILKFRNTQSATGVLFVGVVLVFVGELTAALLHRELALAL